MTYKVICGGIIRANGQLALYGTILDEGELDDPISRIKEGYVEAVEETAFVKAEAPAESESKDEATADNADDLLSKTKAAVK